MDTFEAITTRRSVKHYDPDHVMTRAEIDRLLELTILSPTAFNIQNWRFVVVEDPALRQRIREASYNQAQVTDASALIVICADLKAWAKEPVRYWASAEQPVRDTIVPAIDRCYRGQDQFERDEAMRSCGIAAQTLMLAARAMGYDTCPMEGFDFAQVGELIRLPEEHLISMFVVVGKALQPARPRGGQLPLDEVVVTDGF